MIRHFSSGGVVYKIDPQSEEILFLITKSAPSPTLPKSFWRIPKGWIDDSSDGKNPGILGLGMKKATEKDLSEAAIREVKEESGIKAEIIRKLGTYSYIIPIKPEKIFKFVTMYLMRWKEDLPEGFGFETLEIAWAPFEKAKKMLESSQERKMLALANEIVIKEKLEGEL